MIFVFIEDGTLDVVDNDSEANELYEGIDVESGVYEFYDDNGLYLKPVFTTPNKYKKYLFGLFSIVKSGEYVLRSSNEVEQDSFNQMLAGTQSLNQNKWFKSLSEIKDKYANNT